MPKNNLHQSLIYYVNFLITLSCFKEDCTDIWQALASVRGVVSCQFNLELHTCTLTVFSSMNPESLVQMLSNKCGLEADVVRPGFQVN